MGRSPSPVLPSTYHPIALCRSQLSPGPALKARVASFLLVLLHPPPPCPASRPQFQPLVPEAFAGWTPYQECFPPPSSSQPFMIRQSPSAMPPALPPSSFPVLEAPKAPALITEDVQAAEAGPWGSSPPARWQEVLGSWQL